MPDATPVPATNPGREADVQTIPAHSPARRSLTQVPTTLEVPSPSAQRIAELLGECSVQLSDLLDEELPAGASLPERRRRAQLINNIRITLSSTGLLIGVSYVFGADQ